MVTCELGSTLRHQRGQAEPLWELESAAGPQHSAPLPARQPASHTPTWWVRILPVVIQCVS